MWGKIILRSGIAIALVVLLLFLVAFTLLNWPQILLTPNFIKKVAGYVSHTGIIAVTMDDVEVSCSSMGLFDNRVRFKFKNICVENHSGHKKLCFDDADIAFRYKIMGFSPRIKEAGPVNLSGGVIQYEVSKKVFRSEPRKQIDAHLDIPSVVLPKILKDARFFPSKIGVNDFRYLKSGNDVRGKIDLEFMPDAKGMLTDVDVVVRLVMPQNITVDAGGKIASESGFVRDDVSFSGNIDLQSAYGGNVIFKGDVDRISKNEIKYSGNLSYKKGSLAAVTPVDGLLSQKVLKSSTRLNITNPNSILEKITTDKCELSIGLENADKNDGKLELRCPAMVYLKPVNLPDEMETVYSSPEAVRIDFSAKLNTFFIPDVEHEIKGDINIRLSSAKGNLIETSGSMTVHLEGLFADFPVNMRISSNMDIDFDIRDFARLANELDGTPIAIPAPFHVLTGAVNFSLEGYVPSMQSISSFPVVFKSALKAENEKVYLDAKGEARFRLKGATLDDTEFDLDMVLTDVEVPLPNISLAALPRLAPDPRIKCGRKAGKRGDSEMSYKLDITTPEDVPLRVLSNISAIPIPVHIDIKGDSGKYSGTIKIDMFPLNLFRKKAMVNSFIITFKDPIKKSEVAGDFQLKVQEYMVSVLMKGTVENPNIWFESKPSLSEENIIALLMYGETFDDLDEDSALSIGNMRAAMENKALALVTFLVFASTPIQGVLYNPATNSVTAMIKLGEKTSLAVGSTQDQQRGAGIRQRLGGGWIINTSINEDQQTSQASGSAYIEWHKRY